MQRHAARMEGTLAAGSSVVGSKAEQFDGCQGISVVHAAIVSSVACQSSPSSSFVVVESVMRSDVASLASIKIPTSVSSRACPARLHIH